MIIESTVCLLSAVSTVCLLTHKRTGIRNAVECFIVISVINEYKM